MFQVWAFGPSLGPSNHFSHYSFTSKMCLLFSISFKPSEFCVITIISILLAVNFHEHFFWMATTRENQWTERMRMQHSAKTNIYWCSSIKSPVALFFVNKCQRIIASKLKRYQNFCCRKKAIAKTVNICCVSIDLHLKCIHKR